MYLLAGLLAVGFVANLLVTPLAAAAAAGPSPGPPLPAAPPHAAPPAAAATGDDGPTAFRPADPLVLAAFWLLVTLPMAWGLWATLGIADPCPDGSWPRW